MTSKQQFFGQVLGGLKEHSAYFSRDSILAAKHLKDDATVKELEAQIDRHFFRLYGMTPEEIALVQDR